MDGCIASPEGMIKRQKEETEMEIRDMESKDYPEIDRLMKELQKVKLPACV